MQLKSTDRWYKKQSAEERKIDKGSASSTSLNNDLCIQLLYGSWSHAKCMRLDVTPSVSVNKFEFETLSMCYSVRSPWRNKWLFRP